MNNSSTSCVEFGHKAIVTVILTKIIMSSVGFVLCTLAILFILVTKFYKRFVYRLVLYLLIAALLESLAFVSEEVFLHNQGEQVVLRNSTIARNFCVFSAYFSEIAVLGEDIVICWIMVYLLLIMCNYITNQPKHEIIGVAISIAVPFLICWVPFVKHRYGFSGLWCWIKLTNSEEDCAQNIYGLIYMSTLYYGPMTVVAIFSLVSFLVIVVMVCRSGVREGLWEALPLVIYALIYDCLCGLDLANRIYYIFQLKDSSNPKPVFGLWLAVAVGDPVRTLFPSIAFFLHPGVWKRVCYMLWGRYRTSAPTSFEVSSRDSDSTSEEKIRFAQETASHVRYDSVFDYHSTQSARFKSTFKNGRK